MAHPARRDDPQVIPLPTRAAYPVQADDDDRAPLWVCGLVWIGAATAAWTAIIWGAWALLTR